MKRKTHLLTLEGFAYLNPFSRKTFEPRIINYVVGK